MYYAFPPVLGKMFLILKLQWLLFHIRKSVFAQYLYMSDIVKMKGNLFSNLGFIRLDVWICCLFNVVYLDSWTYKY